MAAQHLDAMEDVAVELRDVKNARRALQEGAFEQAVHVAALYAALDILEGREINRNPYNSGTSAVDEHVGEASGAAD